MARRGKIQFYAGVITFSLSLLIFAYISTLPQYKNARRTDTSAASSHVTKKEGGLPVEKPKRRLPNTLIVGCAKCGTRALLFYFQFHPDVINAAPETHFFDRDENYRKGYGWYMDFFPPRHHNQIGIEKTPAYFTVEGVPERIHKMNSTIKIIVIVCEPVRKAVSQFAQLLNKEGTNEKSLEVLVQNPQTGQLDPNKGTIAAGIYQKHLQRWLQWFPLEQMLFVDGDRLIVDPLSELRLVEEFLGVSHFFSKDLIVFDKTKGFFCVNKNGIRCLGGDKGRPHPPVDPVLKQKIADFYQPFNQKFMLSVGRRFSWNLWN